MAFDWQNRICENYRVDVWEQFSYFIKKLKKQDIQQFNHRLNRFILYVIVKRSVVGYNHNRKSAFY